ncbi:hypothetical protein [Actinoplanes sp. CA-252034]|uniref:hypothetical protein n=1 Tax=Actinoplanes sp. CA-252034 TaxID=3239906 RepID=UPI003D96A236
MSTARLPYPEELSWADVDPGGRSFDRASVPGVVSALAVDTTAPYPLLQGVSAGLAERYGVWTVGWRWSSGEDSGGPVTAWCCQSHSVTKPEATAAGITAALLEWHDWLLDTCRGGPRRRRRPGDPGLP